MRHREMDDPSVYAKRSFPLSTVNTRQTPSRVTASSASRRDICRRGNQTNPAEHIVHKWNTVRSVLRVGPGRKKDVPRSICPFLHCGPPNAVTRHTGSDQSTQMVHVRNVVRITETSRINNYHNNIISCPNYLSVNVDG